MSFASRRFSPRPSCALNAFSSWPSAVYQSLPSVSTPSTSNTASFTRAARSRMSAGRSDGSTGFGIRELRNWKGGSARPRPENRDDSMHLESRNPESRLLDHPRAQQIVDMQHADQAVVHV